jgi:hypothetical protein
MPIKGFFMASACVLFERAVAFEQLDGALTGFEIVTPRGHEPGVRRADADSRVPARHQRVRGGRYGGQTVARSHGRSENGSDTFRGVTFPEELKRARQHSWGWPEGATIADRHSVFVRILASYVFGVPDGAPIFPKGYNPLAELEFLTRIALALLRLPGALCYFNPNGEALGTPKVWRTRSRSPDSRTSRHAMCTATRGCSTWTTAGW